MAGHAKCPDLLPVDVLVHAAECLKVMAHPVRLRMVDLLMQGEFIVQEIAGVCGVQPHQACEHLRLMKACGLLASERRGRQVYYRIASPQLPGLIHCVRQNCQIPGPLPAPSGRPDPEPNKSISRKGGSRHE
jgi:ArsR family transcriptional regulator, zinc-responsive transcriptional repressor